MIPLAFNRWCRHAGLAALLAVGPWSVTSVSGAVGDGGRGDSRYEEAVVLVADGELEEASRRLKAILTESSDNLSARILLGRVYLSIGYAAAAEEQFRIAMRVGADLGLVAVALGESLRDQRRFRELLDTLKPSTFTQSVRGQVLVLHGEAYLALGVAQGRPRRGDWRRGTRYAHRSQPCRRLVRSRRNRANRGRC